VFSAVLLGIRLRRDAGPEGVHVRVATTAADLATVREMRTRYADGHLLNGELDAADRAGTLLIATVRGEPVGTARCLSGPAGALPIAEAIPAFAHVLPAEAPYVEVARLVVAPDHRYFGVTAALAEAILQELPRTGARGAVSVVQAPGAPYYRRLGFRTRAIAPWRGIPCHLMTADDDGGFPMMTAIQALIAAAGGTPTWRPRPAGAVER
jgi:GNAT superfamily N-acetyltransferase